MGNLTEGIRDNVEQLKGKSAEIVTHTLKTYSNNEEGSMVDGLMNIIEAFINDKNESVSLTKKIYGIGGITVGFVLCGIATTIYRHTKKRKTILEDKNETLSIDIEKNNIGMISEEENELKKEI